MGNWREVSGRGWGRVIRENLWDLWGVVIEEPGTEGLGFRWVIRGETLVSEDCRNKGNSAPVAPLSYLPESISFCIGDDLVGPVTFCFSGGFLEGSADVATVLVVGRAEVCSERAAFLVPPGDCVWGERPAFVEGHF